MNQIVNSTVKEKKPAKVKVEEWLPYTPSEYEKAINEMVHHSFKITHSAIHPGGVRVSQQEGLKLPYISVRSLIGDGETVLTDTFGKGPTSIQIHKQITAVALGVASHAPAQEIDLIEGYLKIAANTAYVKCQSISPRLRQILLPTDDGYLAVTPLSAAGIGLKLGESIARLNDRVDLQNKDKSAIAKPLKKLRRASIPIGGSKSFNVGNLVHKMTSPLVASFPTADNAFRQALSLHHKGVPLTRFPDSLVRDYVTWRNGLLGATSASNESRAVLQAFLRRFSRHWLGLGADAYDLLCEHSEALPQSVRLVSDALSSFDQGLIDSSLRDSEWNYQFSSRLAKKISMLERDAVRRFEYSQSDINSMATMVRSILV